MNIQQMNIKLREALEEWNPLGNGSEAYETEIVDVIQLVHDIDNKDVLSKRIQDIYEFSFEERIPIEQCEKMARTLITIHSQASCEL
ncbi:DUF1871 family protein [Heyndrickxia sp. NPDC080065]|uniref:DUF1871 family protein n=1 Tax=Heyndrickxia sp. NPDC080065 TaxID=3390568 RepID=UPI003CFEBB1A